MRTILGGVPGFTTALLGRAFRVDDPSANITEQPRETSPTRADGSVKLKMMDSGREDTAIQYSGRGGGGGVAWSSDMSMRSEKIEWRDPPPKPAAPTPVSKHMRPIGKREVRAMMKNNQFITEVQKRREHLRKNASAAIDLMPAPADDEELWEDPPGVITPG